MNERSLREFCDEAKGLIERESYPEAIEVLRHILRYYPKHIESYALLGQACLEQGEIREAVELFQRTLSADPENITAWIGLASAYEHDHLPDQTIWYLERALEIDPGNAGVREALQRLYAQRQGIKELRLKLNSAALGRVYLRGGLYHQAISELRSLLEKDPHRADVKVSLAKAYWYAGQRVQAADMCLDLLEQLPNCLQANLILGEIWSRGDRQEEGQERLKLAEALDPENRMAQEIFGHLSPLKPSQPTLPPMGWTPAAEEPVTAVAPAAVWEELALLEEAKMPALEEKAIPEEPVAIWAEPALLEEAEIPALEAEAKREEVVSAEVPAVAFEESEIRALAEELPPELRVLVEEALGGEAKGEVAPLMVEEETERETLETAEPIPSWLHEAAEEVIPALAGEALAEEAAPEAPAEPVAEEEIPAWLRALAEQEAEAAPTPPAPSVPPLELEEEATLPDWLLALVAKKQEREMPAPPAEEILPEPQAEEEAAPALEFEEPLPDWLQKLREAAVEQGPALETPWAIEPTPLALEEEAWKEELGKEIAETKEEAKEFEAPPPAFETPPAAHVEIAEEIGPVAAPAEMEAEAELEAEKEAALERPAEWLEEMAEVRRPEEIVSISMMEEMLVEALETATPSVFEAVEAPAAVGEEVKETEEAIKAAELEVEEVIKAVAETTMEPEAKVAAEVAVEPEIAVEAVIEAVARPEAEEAIEVIGEMAVEPGIEEVIEVAAEPAPAITLESASPFIQQATERLKIRPDDHEMRLALARAWRDLGQFDSAAVHYDILIQGGQYLDSIVADLEMVAASQPAGHAAWILLGDAYMQQGRLSDALDAYRHALGR